MCFATPGYHLHPPLLRTLGLRRKLTLGRWAEPLLHALVGWRRLRGTWLDPFAWLPSRRVDREIRAWYQDLLGRLATGLTAHNRDRAEHLASRTESIRGYEALRIRRWHAMRREAERALADFEKNGDAG